MSNRILFILKRREDYNPEKHSKVGLSTGLYNSATFMKDMLLESGIESKLVVVEDNNSIDREVTQYRPTHVIIEALWVVPTKFIILSKLHPSVKWIIRLHSEIPFLAGEGMAMDWIAEYMAFPNIILGANAPRALEEVRFYVQCKKKWDDKLIKEKVIYLPNFYPQKYKVKELNRGKEYIDIGCFGAVRPLKNHILQAIAAIKFAEHIGKKLRFHINSGRIEMKGEPVQRNLEYLFMHLIEHGHELVNHPWAPREEFLEVCAQMDIGMQVSFSETFNIVGADLISQGVPLVGSKEIPWIDDRCCARATETEEMFKTLLHVYDHPETSVKRNQKALTKYTNETRKIWTQYFKTK